MAYQGVLPGRVIYGGNKILPGLIPTDIPLIYHRTVWCY